MSRLPVRWLVLAVATAATLAAHRQLDVSARVERGELYVPRPGVARLLALGFDAMLADYYWIQAVQVVGADPGAAREKGPLLGRLVDVITSLNPWTSHPYRFAALWLTATPEQVREANRLLERGIEYHPDDWRNRFYLGFNRFYYLNDYAGAAEALEPAVHLKGGPAPYGGVDVPDPPVYLKRLVARLRANSGDLETAAGFVEALAASAEDPAAREQYQEALLEIRTERRARLLDTARARYRERFGRDIERVEDLTAGEWPVLPRLPREPNGAGWMLDPEQDRIVSTWYRRRYEVRGSAFSPTGDWGRGGHVREMP